MALVPMALRIACDLDGTLADMDTAIQQEAERLFGSGVDVRMRVAPVMPAATLDAGPPGQAIGGRRPLTRAETRRLWAHVRRIENFWTLLREVEPGVVARFAALAAADGWEVLFITQRPATAGDTAQRQSQQWLRAAGFDCPSVYVVGGSRGRVADALDLHVALDDSPDHCVDVKTGSRARPLLVWRRPVATVPPGVVGLGIQVVPSVAEALDTLGTMSRQAAGRGGLMARLRRALGAP
jgi:hypothetical protein